MNSGVRGPVALGLALVVLAGAGSYAWLAVSAPPGAASAAASPAAASPSVPPADPGASASVAPAPPDAGATPALGYTQEAVDSLATLVPAAFRSSCVPVAPSADALLPTPGAIAALRCTQGGKTLLYETLPDLAETQRSFASLTSATSVAPGSDGCWDGSPGAVAYTYGQVVCWTTSADTGSIAWTYEPANVIAAVTTDGDLRPLLSWWWFRALVQPPANAAGLTPDEQDLVDLLPGDLRGTCRHYEPEKDASGYDPVGSLGSVDCFPKSARIADVGVFAFTTAEALDAWYEHRVALAKVKPASGGCLDGTPGETTWKHGRILCFVTSGRKAAIRWTDDRHQLYGALNATGKDLGALVDWWRSLRLP